MNIIRYIIVLVVFAILSVGAQAQDKAVTGNIYDSQTKQALAGVSIKNAKDQVLAESDRYGHFSFQQSGSDHLIRFVLVGFKTQAVDYTEKADVINIQLDADESNLNEVRVTGFAGNRTKKETAGAIALITSKDINRGSGMSFQQALNAIPGVRMDQSTLSEARISIRGNGVRSSFGLRNIKVYLNDIPVTEADGTTRIEALDVNSIGRAEVIKGPASSIYGAGTGGVINFQLQRSPYGEQSFEASALAGSYGLHRLAATYRSGGDQINSYVSYGWQEYDGYRQHSNDMRRFLSGNFQLFPSNKRIITLLLNRTTQYSQIPGSLTASQVEADPKQANASNLDKQAGRYQTWTRVGLGQQYKFNDQFSNSTSVFTYSYDLNHPLPYAYLRNFYQSYGGRTSFTYEPAFTVLPTKFIVGTEFNQGLTKGTQYVNNKGQEGALTANIDYRNTLYSLFYQSETQLGSQTLLTLGLSYNSLKYDVSNYLIPAQSGIKDFKPQATPRIALSHNFSEALSLHASVSSGFSPPSSSEVKNVDGSINPNLQAEKAVNYEINAKGNLFHSRFSYDLAVFKMDMKGELIAQSVQQGITIYNNAGKTTHNGAELALSWQALKPDDQNAIASLRPFVALTYSDFTFKDYQVLNAANQVTATYNGNELTGVAPWVLSAGLDVETRLGLYVNLNYYYNDRMPLNDSNTDYNKSYGVAGAKVGYKRKLGLSFEMNIYGGLDNIFDESYSSIISLNAAAASGGQPAYFNPSPKRNGYAGLSLKYFL
ncbi:iron complex outermembrane recepter protein [Pedobacter westerhofensis]|uniref:Iron complex outermembrane recepter protein n=1 Tax=Pedobacter westerhofensis TaxID=425512 RepID=A0A521FQ35_9SPHI|nr:TonB-dependent receptor [Pedobacter westerhofensis]SMO97640.1 iron complex outermembrane recepter protein [Pedobacter westerhofensis]